MREKLLNDILKAMKEKDKETLNTLRMVKGAMQLEEINKKHELNDDELITVIAKQIKTRKESLSEFEKANRDDLVVQVTKEIALLNLYMPKQMEETEIRELIDKVISKVEISGHKSMGIVMKEITPLVRGKADMNLVTKIVKEKLEM